MFILYIFCSTQSVSKYFVHSPVGDLRDGLYCMSTRAESILIGACWMWLRYLGKYVYSSPSFSSYKAVCGPSSHASSGNEARFDECARGRPKRDELPIFPLNDFAIFEIRSHGRRRGRSIGTFGDDWGKQVFVRMIWTRTP